MGDHPFGLDDPINDKMDLLYGDPGMDHNKKMMVKIHRGYT